ncbi:hypothetical protein [Streptomyces sp. NPDC058620]|uniref:hypothetical protein n=1 Tax=Streptomyces sp. NPDC058620 TaxID=3346560 RepID=UPI003646F204
MSADRCCGRLWTVMVLVMQTDAPLWDSLVFDGIDDVNVEAVTAVFGTVEVMARGRAASAACPDCGRFSDRVHDRCQRRLRDLPLADQGGADGAGCCRQVWPAQLPLSVQPVPLDGELVDESRVAGGRRAIEAMGDGTVEA